MARDFFVDRSFYILRLKQGVLVFVACGLATASTYGADQAGNAAVGAAVGALIVAVALASVLMMELRRMRSHRLFLLPPGDGTLKKFGYTQDARWLSWYELWKDHSWRHDDLFIGRMLNEQFPFGIWSDIDIGSNSKLHFLTVAQNGAGKSVSAVIPNLINYPGSALVVDPKGELTRITADRRGKGGHSVTDFLGQTVHIFDPFNTVPEYSPISYNPLAELNPNEENAVDDAQVIAAALIPPQSSTDANSAFFLGRARSFLQAMILHVITVEPPERQTLGVVRDLIVGGDREGMEIANAEARRLGQDDAFDSAMDALLAIMQENDAFNGIIAAEASALRNGAHEERSGVLGTAAEQTSFLTSPGVRRSLDRADFLMRNLKHEKTTIYLVLPALKIAGDYVRVMTLIINLAAEMMEREKVDLDVPVLFMFDEFAAFGYLASIEKSFGLMRGLGMRIWPIIQDISQIQKLYPSTWQSIVGNCGGVQFMGTKSRATADFIAEQMPKAQVLGKSGQMETSQIITAEEIITELSATDAHRQIFIPAGKSPAILRSVPYWELYPSSMYRAGIRT